LIAQALELIALLKRSAKPTLPKLLEEQEVVLKMLIASQDDNKKITRKRKIVRSSKAKIDESILARYNPRGKKAETRNFQNPR